MCGIVGYLGDREALEVLVDSLRRLEYRGYDSAGFASIVRSGGANDLEVRKAPGYIDAMASEMERKGARIGIGHTRWATHGVPNQVNAHPHCSCDGTIAVAHNGIIDNHTTLKDELASKGHEFRSQTDSEVIPHLIEEYYDGDLEEAVARAVERLEGSFAFLAIHRDHPDRIVCYREKSPLVLGKGAGEGFIASDVTALLSYTNSFLYMEDGETAVVKADGISVRNRDGDHVDRTWKLVDWRPEDAEKSGFKHFMIKEIHEQPRSMHQTLAGWMSDEDALPPRLVRARTIKIVSCGTSYHAGLLGKYLFERYAGIPTTVEMASEYRYADRTEEDSLVILISQSGETADTIAAAREAKRRGMFTLAVTNVLGSTISREADHTLYLRSGPEIGVAASKTFTSQVMMMYLLSSTIGHRTGHIGRDEFRKVKDGLRSAIRAVEKVLGDTEAVKAQAEWLSSAHHAFFLGRYINFPAALEASLKMKEISYIHSEGYPAGELKHGPLALLQKDTPVIALISDDHTYSKMLGNIGECAARSSPVLVVAPEGDSEVSRYTDRILRYPWIDPMFSPLAISVTMQLLAYYVADLRGCSIDKPRNLAKSVTVE
ncbi:MAG: glutamine--fructose-6-phosphate transaminase (isomerizing) [Candidatus Thermoplasmatota archaeon]|nr:glutamine--fructose-6-phosphate transaminase (isomerizing) [Candidatus Thermoplasmatota archaeon]